MEGFSYHALLFKTLAGASFSICTVVWYFDCSGHEGYAIWRVAHSELRRGTPSCWTLTSLPTQWPWHHCSRQITAILFDDLHTSNCTVAVYANKMLDALNIVPGSGWWTERTFVQPKGSGSSFCCLAEASGDKWRRQHCNGNYPNNQLCWKFYAVG